MGPLTLHQLHDNVNGLFLRADADEPHNVWVPVLLENPVGTRMGTVSVGGPAARGTSHPQGTLPSQPGDTALSTRVLQLPAGSNSFKTGQM